jgi:hypothetical protein
VEQQDDYHIMKCKRCKKTQYWPNLRYDPDTCLGGLRKIKKMSRWPLSESELRTFPVIGRIVEYSAAR